MSSRTRRGFTLVETLVAATVSLLVLGTASLLIAPVLRGGSRTTARVELQQEAILAVDRLMADLGRCVPAGLAVAPGAVSLHPVVDVTAEIPPVPVFAPELTIYYRQASLLLRQQVAAPSTTQPFRPSPLPVLSGGAQLAHDVTQFQVACAGSTVTVTLELQRQAGGRDPERVGLKRTLSLRQAE